MATLPAPIERAHRRVRPASQLRAARRIRGARRARPHASKTHCCFCGQQCGVQLLVKDEQVVGVEPWEEFPFNRGQALSRRASSATCRTTIPTACSSRSCAPAAASRRSRGTRRSTWSPSASSASSARHGRDAVAVLSGASLTNEKAYLMGKFARLARRHAPHRLQRPPLHGRRRRRQPEGVRHRPRRQPVGRHRRDRPGDGARLERVRVQPDHHRLHLARARPRRAADRRRSAADADRAHRRPLPAGAARAATRR